ncbi:MAG: hypothetical protein LUK37_26535 [Clostridia bacterium]|nr:hypothetical protein [Clostridia bacterium]
MSKENPSCNDAIQMLLDIRRAAATIGNIEIAEQAIKLFKALDKQKGIARLAQMISRQRQYRYISFVMQSTLDNNVAVLTTLDSAARLVWQAYMMCATNQYIQLTQLQIMCLSGLKSRKTVKRAVTDLVCAGLLIPVKNRTNKTATIYRLNTALARSGKVHILDKDISLLARAEAGYSTVSQSIKEEISYRYTALLPVQQSQISSSGQELYTDDIPEFESLLKAKPTKPCQ